MKITSFLLAGAVALSVPLMGAGCSVDRGEQSEIGTLEMPLTTTSASGAVYRLTNAMFDIEGTSAASINSDDFAGQSAATIDLPEGPYEITLAPSWVLERQGPSGFAPVVAELKGPATQPFDIVADGSTQVVYVFRAAGEEIVFGQGELQISFEVEEVPEGWTCSLNFYDSQDGCDCACGLVDPDCSIPDQEVFGCNPGQTCNDGVCEGGFICGDGVQDPGEGCDDGNNVDGDGCSASCINENVPSEWACDPVFYDAADGCDCACGAPDPDCDLPDQQIFNCAPGQTCSSEGLCEGGFVCGDGVQDPGEGCDDGNNVDGDGCSASCVSESVPSEWACNPVFYDAADGCDCACGAPDPDCDLPDQQLFNCEDGQVCSSEGLCVGP